MINGTLFLQMFHFFVAYLLLKYILFKPALAVVIAHEERVLQLNHDIVLLKNTVAQGSALKKEQQGAWLRKVATIKPDVARVISEPVRLPTEELPVIKSEQEQKIVTAAVRRIVDLLGSPSQKTGAA